MRPGARKHEGRAFTLLEIMVALALLGIIVAAIYSSWYAILKGSAAAQNAAAGAQRMRITMRTLQDSLLSACFFNENAKYYGFVSEAEGDYSSLSFVARLPKTFPRSGKFGDLDLRRLTFSIEAGPDAKKQLVLRQNPILMELDKDEQETPLVLARDVDKFVLEYWDVGQKDWTRDWKTTNQLPLLVNISLGLGHKDPYTGLPQQVMFSRVVLPAQAVRREWQIPQTGPTAGPPTNGVQPNPNQPGQPPGVSNPPQLKTPFTPPGAGFPPQ